jgi:CheY-like chemotaxis protein
VSNHPHALICISLAVTKGIVELHGGKVSVHSDGEGCGSTFYLSLPVYRCSAPNFENPVRRLSYPAHADDKSSVNSKNSSIDVSGHSIRSLDGHLMECNRRSSLRGRTLSGSASSLHDWTTNHVSSTRTNPTNMRHLHALQHSDSFHVKRSGGRSERCRSGRVAPDTTSCFISNSSVRDVCPQVCASSLRMLAARRRLLLVDDSKSNRAMLHRILRDQCEEIVEAEDGMHAVEIIEQANESSDRFDLVLMDYEMPNMDGPTAALTIRQLEYTGGIIELTGNTLQSQIDKYKSHGANVVLCKLPDVRLLLEHMSGMI